MGRPSAVVVLAAWVLGGLVATTSTRSGAARSDAAPARPPAVRQTGAVVPPDPAAVIPATGATASDAIGDAGSTQALPQVPLDPDVAALPPAHGAKIAIVIDDTGQVDTYLPGYLSLPEPVTISIIPFFPHAPEDDDLVHRANREVLMHIPLANRPGPGGIPYGGGLAVGTDPAAVENYVAGAFARVPHAVGANNHEGPYGSSSPELMRPLLQSLATRHLFFMDSVTSQRTVGFAMARDMGMPPRINNVFLDHLEYDADSRRALLELAGDAAHQGTAVGIAHVFHPYLLHVLQAIGPQLRARGYVFSPLSQVTDLPAPTGLDVGVRWTLSPGPGAAERRNSA